MVPYLVLSYLPAPCEQTLLQGMMVGAGCRPACALWIIHSLGLFDAVFDPTHPDSSSPPPPEDWRLRSMAMIIISNALFRLSHFETLLRSSVCFGGIPTLTSSSSAPTVFPCFDSGPAIPILAEPQLPLELSDGTLYRGQGAPGVAAEDAETMARDGRMLMFSAAMAGIDGSLPTSVRCL